MNKDKETELWFEIMNQHGLITKDIYCSCTNCPANDKCKYAFDLYNSNGDCLLEK